ncbi:MAG: transcriptional regulator [Syntrophus sp. (in: bacteria)]|nr:transcriptional regulator [Syntrophus sp. (in: bacteria)]
MKHKTLRNYVDEQMNNPEFKEEWDALDPEFQLIESIIKAREKAGLTQAELALKIGTKQPALSRLERGGFKTATVDTLKKIAHALNTELIIKFQPGEKKA